jgi:hypothetical protein
MAGFQGIREMKNDVILLAQRDGHAALCVKGIIILRTTLGHHDNSSMSAQFNCRSKARHPCAQNQKIGGKHLQRIVGFGGRSHKNDNGVE